MKYKENKLALVDLDSVNYNVSLHKVILYKTYNIRIVSKYMGEIKRCALKDRPIPYCLQMNHENEKIYQCSY